jgi:hypothetical protein
LSGLFPHHTQIKENKIVIKKINMADFAETRDVVPDEVAQMFDLSLKKKKKKKVELCI